VLILEKFYSAGDTKAKRPEKGHGCGVSAPYLRNCFCYVSQNQNVAVVVMLALVRGQF